MNDYVPDVYKKDVVILGCGNILFGDDGFGPEVINYLEANYSIPENVCALDTGTGVREILFDITLSEKKPKKIIIIDAVDVGKIPGELFEIEIDDIPMNKIDDFSMHQVPTSNLLKELKDSTKVDVSVIACQVKVIPDIVTMGLSNEIQKAIPLACEMVMEKTL